MEKLGEIRRMYFRDKLSLHQKIREESPRASAPKKYGIGQNRKK